MIKKKKIPINAGFKVDSGNFSMRIINVMANDKKKHFQKEKYCL